MKIEKKFKYAITNDEYDALETVLDLLEEVKESCAEDMATVLDENIVGNELVKALTYAPKNGFDNIISILRGIKNCSEDPNEI